MTDTEEIGMDEHMNKDASICVCQKLYCSEEITKFVIQSKLLQEETLVAFQLPECYRLIAQLANIVHYGLCKANVEVTVLDASAHTVPT